MQAELVDPVPVPTSRRRQADACNFVGPAGEACSKPARTRGLCRTHYIRQYRAGAFDKPARSELETPQADLTLGKALQARDKLLRHAEIYADLHLIAARKAAKKGNATPSEWALLHTRAVTPVDKGDSGPKVAVTVGVVLPGLGLGQAPTMTVQALPASAEPTDS